MICKKPRGFPWGFFAVDTETVNGHPELIQVAIILCFKELPKDLYQQEVIFPLRSRALQVIKRAANSFLFY